MFPPKLLMPHTSQRAQYPLVKEYTSNHKIKAPLIQETTEEHHTIEGRVSTNGFQILEFVLRDNFRCFGSLGSQP